MDKLADLLKTIGAPVLGTVIGGPVGTLAGAAIGALADALGTAPTPEAVAERLAVDNPADRAAAQEVARNVERDKAVAYLDELKARLADTQNARQQTLQLVEAGSSMAWGAPVVSIVVLIGFVALSVLAMRPDLAGVRENVTLYLLGAWQSLATAVVGYWIGSSAGSARSGDAVRALAQRAIAPEQAIGRAVETAVKTMAAKR